jgi:tetratricopeptide (TPR) repeat protein
MFLALLLALQAPPSYGPRLAVITAVRAVEGDSVPAVRARWSARLARDRGDRASRLGMATLDWLTFDHPAADSEFSRLLADNSTDSYAAYAKLGSAEANLWRISFDSSRVRYTDAVLAARALHDSEAEAEGLALLGFLRSRTSGFPAGLATLDTADRVIPAGNDSLHAFVDCTQAPIASFSGAAAAWATAQRGMARARAIQNRRLQAICYQALGEVAINMNSGAAQVYFDSSEVIKREIHEGPMLAIVLFVDGYHRLAMLDIAGARRVLLTAIEVGQRADCPFAVAWARRFLSNLYWQVGDLESADREFRLSADLFQRLDDHMGLLNMRRSTGASALALGRLDEADSNFRRSQANAEGEGHAEGVYFARLELAAVQAQRGHWSDAVGQVQKVITYGRTHGHAAWVGSLQYTLGLLALRQHDQAGAERHLGLALAGTGADRLLDRYAIHSRLAELRIEEGQLPRGLTEITTASDELDSLRSRLDDQTLKLMIFQTRYGYDEEDLGLATIAAALVRGGYAGPAFRLSEQRRARALDDHLLQAELLHTAEPGGGRHDRHQHGSVEAEMIQSGLPDEGTVLLEYLTGPRAQPTTLFMVSRAGLRAFRLAPIDSLADLITRFTGLLQSGAEAESVGGELRAALLDSAVAALGPGIHRLVIVPDGVLNRLPFDLLPLSGGQPVLTRYAVTLAPSAAVALRLWGRPLDSVSGRVLALGDPAFANERVPGQDGAADTYRSAFDESGGLTRLAASAAEVRTIASFSPDPVLKLRAAASESYLKRSPLEGFGIIHLATHALVDDRSPTRTAIALAPGEGEDGFVGPAELAALRIRAQIVVLSGCRTAGGMVVGGEGVQGLTSPLLEAGARSVVATIWSVGDRSTARFMSDFYLGLARHKPVGEALRAAKVAAIARHASPAEWAGFEVIGDPLALVPLREPVSRLPWIIVAGAGLLAGLLWLSWRVRGAGG